MKKLTDSRWALAAVVMAVFSIAVASADQAPTVSEQVAGLQQMCSDSEQARAQRQSDQALYHRLGGYDRIHEFTREVVRLHNQNDAIKRLFVHVDSDKLAKHVADFVAAGTGGTATYTGRDMPTSHAHLQLTDADFLSAGGDIVKAMQTMGYGQNEIDEMLCILVSLKPQVVLE